jgi:hypothetical protein
LAPKHLLFATTIANFTPQPLGEEQQLSADELLVDGADSDAQEAVRLGDKTLAEAQEKIICAGVKMRFSPI